MIVNEGKRFTLFIWMTFVLMHANAMDFLEADCNQTEFLYTKLYIYKNDPYPVYKCMEKTEICGFFTGHKDDEDFDKKLKELFYIDIKHKIIHALITDSGNKVHDMLKDGMKDCEAKIKHFEISIEMNEDTPDARVVQCMNALIKMNTKANEASLQVELDQCLAKVEELTAQIENHKKELEAKIEKDKKEEKKRLRNWKHIWRITKKELEAQIEKDKKSIRNYQYTLIGVILVFAAVGLCFYFRLMNFRRARSSGATSKDKKIKYGFNNNKAQQSSRTAK